MKIWIYENVKTREINMNNSMKRRRQKKIIMKIIWKWKAWIWRKWQADNNNETGRLMKGKASMK